MESFSGAGKIGVRTLLQLLIVYIFFGAVHVQSRWPNGDAHFMLTCIIIAASPQTLRGNVLCRLHDGTLTEVEPNRADRSSAHKMRTLHEIYYWMEPYFTLSLSPLPFALFYSNVMWSILNFSQFKVNNDNQDTCKDEAMNRAKKRNAAAIRCRIPFFPFSNSYLLFSSISVFPLFGRLTHSYSLMWCNRC